MHIILEVLFPNQNNITFLIQEILEEFKLMVNAMKKTKWAGKQGEMKLQRLWMNAASVVGEKPSLLLIAWWKERNFQPSALIVSGVFRDAVVLNAGWAACLTQYHKVVLAVWNNIVSMHLSNALDYPLQFKKNTYWYLLISNKKSFLRKILMKT